MSKGQVSEMVASGGVAAFTRSRVGPGADPNRLLTHMHVLVDGRDDTKKKSKKKSRSK